MSAAAVTMYNDAEQVIFAPGITNDCLKAFQLELNCGPKLLHLVTYTMQSTSESMANDVEKQYGLN